MILKTTNSYGAKFQTDSDLRNIPNIASQKMIKHKYVHCLPVFNQYKNRAFRFQNHILDLHSQTCSCENFCDNVNLYIDTTDIRRLCSHLIKKLRQLNNEGKIQLDSITLLLLENQQKFGKEQLLILPDSNPKVLFGFSENTLSEWVNIYCTVKESDSVYFCYGFNDKEKRWKRGLIPENSKEILDFLLILK